MSPLVSFLNSCESFDWLGLFSPVFFSSLSFLCIKRKLSGQRMPLNLLDNFRTFPPLNQKTSCIWDAETETIYRKKGFPLLCLAFLLPLFVMNRKKSQSEWLAEYTFNSVTIRWVFDSIPGPQKELSSSLAYCTHSQADTLRHQHLHQAQIAAAAAAAAATTAALAARSTTPSLRKRKKEIYLLLVETEHERV